MISLSTERLLTILNRHPDTIATIVLAITTFIGLTAALVFHPALYLVP